MTTTLPAPGTDLREPRPSRRTLLTGFAVATAGALLALAAHRVVGQIGALTWALLLGALVANLGLLPGAARPGLQRATKTLMRSGVALLGLSLSAGSVISLGWELVAFVTGTLAVTLVVTTWLGGRMGLSRPRSLLVGTGVAICGASAIAAMEDNARGDHEDVAAATATVTVFGSVAMLLLPALQAPLGLSDAQLGVWAGAGVHEVGQVVAAAGPAGAAAVGLAVVVKLTRVLLLAPVVTTVGLVQRRHWVPGEAGSRPPLVPLFVVGFVACVALRSTGTIPPAALDLVAVAQTLLLGAGLFGLGTGVHLRSLARGGGPALRLGLVSSLLVGTLSLAGALWLA